MNTVNVACAIDDSYVSHCGVMLRSLFVNNRGSEFRVFVMHSDLKRDNRQQLEEFVKKCGQCIEFVEIAGSAIDKVPLFGHISLASYFRLLIPRVIDSSVAKILFLDSDLIVRHDISPLWNLNLAGYCHAAVENYGITASFKNNLGLAEGTDYFNSGVMLINTGEWRKLDVTNSALTFLADHSEKVIFWDQDALNYALNGKWLKVDAKWNVQANIFMDNPSVLGLDPVDLELLCHNPAIVHFSGAGAGKPWYHSCKHPMKHEYYAYRKQTPWRRFRPIGKPTVIDQARRVINASYSILAGAPSRQRLLKSLGLQRDE